jgi:hypothetical protein
LPSNENDPHFRNLDLQMKKNSPTMEQLTQQEEKRPLLKILDPLSTKLGSSTQKFAQLTINRLFNPKLDSIERNSPQMRRYTQQWTTRSPQDKRPLQTKTPPPQNETQPHMK